ncbi:MAG: alpha/beta fold hydrolase [Gammaproteobacteria bacterium]|nr:alpha/beta fold hydrolase [Gammaproteobacteria bacterium]
MTGGNAHSALNDFRAAWWLPGGHLQSLRRKFGPGVTVAQESERLPLEDGDFIDLAWVRPGGEIAPGDPVVFVLHGLCGCSESLYVQALQHHLLARGIASVAMNFRGCSGEPNDKARSYHSGVSADVDQVFRKLRERLPGNFFHCVGYSLGGNVLLKWLAETGGPAGLDRAVSISVPFDLAQCSAALGRGLTRYYGRYFLGRLQQDLAAKKSRFRETGNEVELALLEELGPLQDIASLWEFDDRVTAPLHGFADAADYYAKCSSLPLLAGIRTPTLLIQSTDDPLVPPASLPDPARLPENVRLELTGAGGHVGFFAATGSRLEQTVADFLVSE